MATDGFCLDTLLAHLECLWPERVVGISPDDLEWILADFVLSRGQRLRLSMSQRPNGQEYERLSRFGRRYLPFSTAADFPAVATHTVCTLALAAACGILHIVFLDRLVDEPEATPPEIRVAIQHVFLHAYRLLSLLFPVDSPFWDEVQRLMTLTSETMVAERHDHCGQAHPYPWEEFQKIAQGKMASAQVNTVAMALLNGTPQEIPALQECWKAISLAAIVNDDVLDWQEDYNNANYTYLLSQVLLSPPFRDEVSAGRLPTVAEVGVALFFSGLAEAMYSRAWDALQTAKDLAVSRGHQALAHLVCETADWMQDRNDEVMLRKLQRLLLPHMVSSYLPEN
jgi:hypothetical protein